MRGRARKHRVISGRPFRPTVGGGFGLSMDADSVWANSSRRKINSQKMSTLGVEPRTYRSEVCRANPLRHAPLLMVGVQIVLEMFTRVKFAGCRDGLPRGYVLAHCPVFIDRIETTARAPKGSRRGDRKARRAGLPVKRGFERVTFSSTRKSCALHPRRAPSVSNRVPHPLSALHAVRQRDVPDPRHQSRAESAPYAYAAASVVVVAAPVDDAGRALRPAFSRLAVSSSRRESPGYAG